MTVKFVPVLTGLLLMLNLFVLFLYNKLLVLLPSVKTDSSFPFLIADVKIARPVRKEQKNMAAVVLA